MPSRMPPARVVAMVSLVVLLVVVALWLVRGTAGGTSATARDTPTATVASTTPASGLPTIPESHLPRPARDTLALIRAGGPFPFTEDGQTFQNRERLLPVRARGYYREYTVKQGRGGDRGPLRIVRGEEGDLYWTDDHYDSFRQVQEGR